MSKQDLIEVEYEAAKAEALKQLEAVEKLILNHRKSSRHPKLDCGHVGDMNHYAARLRDIAENR